MLIKIGSQWYGAEPGRPIMIQLSDKDKKNIANMDPDCTMYAVFHDKDMMTPDEMRAWMHEGSIT